MGQVLSVLVACVGTVELIDFYRNVTRNFQAPVVSRREQLRKKYLDNLEKRRDEILEEIQRRKKHEEGSQIIDSEKDFSIGTTNCSKPSSVEVRKYFDTNTCFANCETAQHCTGTLCRTAIQNEDKTNVCGINNTTTQDICPNDIICTKPVVGRTSIEEICSTNGSRLSNNKAFKQNTLQKVDNENTSSQVIFKPVAKENFFDSHFTGESFNYSRRAVTEPNMETNFENSRGHGNDVAITNIKNCNSLENSSYSSLSNDSDSTSQLHLIQGESSKSRSRSRSPNPLPNNLVSKRPKSTSQSPNTSPFLSSDETYFREPLSPNQIFVSAPRNSICNYVWDNPTSAVLQVDEDSFVFKCTTPKILLSSNHSFSEYWSNKKWLHSTIICNKKHVRCTSPCPRKIASLGFRCRSKSESDCKDLCSRFHGVSKNKEHFHEQFLNTLDGVTKEGKKRKQKYHLKRNKTKEPKADPTDAAMQGDTGSTKFLDQAVNVLNNNLSGLEDERTTHKSEPFWLIFSGEYTKAMNKDWHGQHFCCWQCDESLTGQRYVLRDDHPYCVSCYESVFANACEKCSKIIGIDSKDLSYKDKHWHEVCFLCTTCGESLVDKQFGSKGDRIYCGRCYDEQFASRCDGCHEIFRAGTKKMEYKTRQWHEKCFCCCVCKVPIGTQSFIPREQEIYCAKCYEEKFATRCIKCNKVITSGGVTYKNEPWHRECFTCTHCTKSLAGERFTSRDEKPYCAECFGELFAKRCFACNKPITGIGGTKFISFEDRHWHNDCFFCASCRTSLVGRGFITDQDDIICPECAKQKLM